MDATWAFDGTAFYPVAGVKEAPSRGNLGGVVVPAGVPITPPQTISECPVHATVASLRVRRGAARRDDQRLARGS